MDCTVHGILQARILEYWVAIPFSRGSSQPRSPALQADSWEAQVTAGNPPNIMICKRWKYTWKKFSYIIYITNAFVTIRIKSLHATNEHNTHKSIKQIH